MSIKPWKRAQVLGTRGHLIETAQRRFGERGYAATALEQLVAEAGLTRGALYHHFKDKRALFAAVLDVVLRDRVETVEKRALRQAFETGEDESRIAVLELVRALSDPAMQRVVWLDGPAVLGHGAWESALERRLLRPIERYVRAASERGALDATLVPTAVRLLLGTIREAALLCGRDPQVEDDVETTLVWQLERLFG